MAASTAVTPYTATFTLRMPGRTACPLQEFSRRNLLTHGGNRLCKAPFYSLESNSHAICSDSTAPFLAGAACGGRGARASLFVKATA